jgi:hypothetical protein
MWLRYRVDCKEECWLNKLHLKEPLAAAYDHNGILEPA